MNGQREEISSHHFYGKILFIAYLSTVLKVGRNNRFTINERGKCVANYLLNYFTIVTMHREQLALT